MSVGLQRLRDEPEVIRKGALDKGEDATLVDTALALDARRRALLGEADARKAERNTASRQIGEAIKGGAASDGPEVAALRAASVAAGERISALDLEIGHVEAELEDTLLRIPNPADPDVPVGDADASVTVRTWGDLLPRAHRADDKQVARVVSDLSGERRLCGACHDHRAFEKAGLRDGAFWQVAHRAGGDARHLRH